MHHVRRAGRPAEESVAATPYLAALGDGLDNVLCAVPAHDIGRSLLVHEDAHHSLEHGNLVLSVGEAGGRTCVTPERVAVNRMVARIPDNDGAQPQGDPVVEGGPDAYLSTLPLDDAVSAMSAAGVPSKVSDTAGLYVCNQVMYRVLHAVRSCGLMIPAGFAHVPYTPIQTVSKPERASLSSELSSAGLYSILITSLA